MERAAWLHVNMTTPGASPCRSPDPAPRPGSNSGPHTRDSLQREPMSSHPFPTHLLQSLHDSPTDHERFSPCLSPSSSPSCGHCVQNSSPDCPRSPTHLGHPSGTPSFGIENCSSFITKPQRSRLPSLQNHGPDRASSSAVARASAAACRAALVERSNLDFSSSSPSRMHALPSLPLHADPPRLAGESCTRAQALAARRQLESTTYGAAPCSDVLGDLRSPADRVTDIACQSESAWVSEIRSSGHRPRMPSPHTACGAAAAAGRVAAAVGPYPGAALSPAADIDFPLEPEADCWPERGCLSPGCRAWLREDMPPAARDSRRLPSPLHVRRLRCAVMCSSVPSHVSRGCPHGACSVMMHA